MSGDVDRLAKMGTVHARVTAEIRREAAELVAGGATWGQLAAALGHSRMVVREEFFDWPHYRQLCRAAGRRSPSVIADPGGCQDAHDGAPGSVARDATSSSSAQARQACDSPDRVRAMR